MTSRTTWRRWHGSSCGSARKKSLDMNQRKSWLCPPFPASCPCRFAMSPSPAPASSNGANGFPVRRFPAGFASRVMRPIGRRARSGGGHILYPVLLKEPELLIHPRLTPPLPAEASTMSRPHQMASHLLLHPGPDVGKAPTRVPDPEVVH